ncbi:MAG: MarR family transcriptional regulator [Lachnospiraceae bacterium]|nr:MarR family transcriptional regulator [Lachnospiraceae bacterium]
MSDRYECLKLKNQLCFPLYAASKEIVRLYKPWLDEIDLTYTQYITMMVLWEKRESNVKELGKCLYLDSGTLTPLLKKLEGKGLIERHRSEEDERNLIIRVTEQGMRLRERAADVPARVGSCVQLSPEEARTLYELTYKVLESID